MKGESLDSGVCEKKVAQRFWPLRASDAPLPPDFNVEDTGAEPFAKRDFFSHDRALMEQLPPTLKSGGQGGWAK